MRKTLIALAVLGLSAGFAHAQSNVTIYGVVDGGYVKETGTDLAMGANNESRIGFRGSEDLGGGLKATFQLEQRLSIANGINTGRENSNNNMYDFLNLGSTDWKGAANIGLAGNFGQVRFGRVDNLGIESYRKIDPFNHYSVGAALVATGNVLYAEQLSNTVRYDSPNWSGFSFGLSWTLANNDNEGNLNQVGLPYSQIGNHGWNINLQYDNGPLLLMGNYWRLADSNNSDAWNLGAAYKFGDVRISLGYQDSELDILDIIPGFDARIKQRDAILGLQWDIGPGQLNASVNYGKAKMDNNSYSEKAFKYSVGYTYNLSKRTAIYGIASYLDSDDELIGAMYSMGGTPRSSHTAFQLGMTHKF